MIRPQKGSAVREGALKTPEQRRRAIEAELRALPELAAPETSWQSIEQRLAGIRHQLPAADAEALDPRGRRPDNLSSTPAPASGARDHARRRDSWPSKNKLSGSGSRGHTGRRLDAPATKAGEGRRLDDARPPYRRFLPPALAAGVAAALALTLLLIERGPAEDPLEVAGPTPGESLVAELMERSRRAETRRRTLPVVVGAGVAPVQALEARRLLTARIAAVDASLDQLAAAGPADPAARARLWRERAELMDTLLRTEQVQREEYFRRAVF